MLVAPCTQAPKAQQIHSGRQAAAAATAEASPPKHQTGMLSTQTPAIAKQIRSCLVVPFHPEQAISMARPYQHGPRNSKCVTFNDKVHVKTMYVWPYAHNAARRSNFMHIVADRKRFQKRIQDMEQKLSPILIKSIPNEAKPIMSIDLITTLFSNFTISHCSANKS